MVPTLVTSRAKHAAALLLALAGIFHLLIAPSHYAHAPGHGLFFAFSGAAQLGWALWFWRQPTRFAYYLGLGLSGGLVVLWLLTRTWSPPFSEQPEPFSASMIGSKMVEVLSFMSLLVWRGRQRHEPYLANTKVGALGVAVIAATLSGLFFFGSGYLAEPMLPGLQHAEEAEHGHDGTEEEDHHAEEGGTATEDAEHGHDGTEEEDHHAEEPHDP